MLFDGPFYLHWKDMRQLEPVNGGGKCSSVGEKKTILSFHKLGCAESD